MSTQRALAKLRTGTDSVAVVDRPVREPHPHEVVVSVIAAGICGTDLHIASDEYTSDPPVTMGHEVTGRVARVGSAVDPRWIGARVVCETYLSTCERCTPCLTGRRNLCVDRRSIGSMEDGAFASEVIVPARNLHRVPDAVGEYAAALAEPLACVCHLLLDPPRINAGDHVLVVGPGPMGLLSAQVAALMGGTVTIAGLTSDEERLALARDLGFSTTTERPAAGSFEVVVECSGSTGGYSVALEAAAPAGRFVQVGISGRDITVGMDRVLYKELTISSGFASTPQSWSRALELMASGQLRLDPLISGVVALDDWRGAFDSLVAGRGLKMLIDPRLEARS